MVTLDNLASKIGEMVNGYSEEIKMKLEVLLDETAEKIVEYIKASAPRSGKSKPLAESFIIKPKGVGVNKVLTIFSESKGRIVHLLEFGFKHKNGKFVTAKPFMRPSYDALTPKMIDDIKSIIESSGK